MTLICSHRVNWAARLEELDPRFGVEIDLRSEGGELVLEHDPFTDGERFEDWLRSYRHAFIVVNIKEEGLEPRIIEALDGAGVRSWAFLDQSFPFLVKLLRGHDTRTMVRVSEYESIETALALPVRPEWVWVDSFTGEWPDAPTLRRLVEAGFRLMLVSPELQGRDLEKEFDAISARWTDAGVGLDGVCTKQPAFWSRPDLPWWVT